MLRKLKVALAFALPASTLSTAAPVAEAAPLDQPIPAGRFFSRTAGRDGQAGFRVSNEAGVSFGDEFQPRRPSVRSSRRLRTVEHRARGDGFSCVAAAGTVGPISP